MDRMASYSKVVWRKSGTVFATALPSFKVLLKPKHLMVIKSPALVFNPLNPTFVCFSQSKAVMNLKLLYSLSTMLNA